MEKKKGKKGKEALCLFCSPTKKSAHQEFFLRTADEEFWGFSVHIVIH